MCYIGFLGIRIEIHLAIENIIIFEQVVHCT